MGKKLSLDNKKNGIKDTVQTNKVIHASMYASMGGSCIQGSEYTGLHIKVTKNKDTR